MIDLLCKVGLGLAITLIVCLEKTGSVDIQWGIIEPFLRRTALQADAYVFGFIRAHLHFVPMYTGYSW